MKPRRRRPQGHMGANVRHPVLLRIKITADFEKFSGNLTRPYLAASI
jgi:hypothetical protein